MIKYIMLQKQHGKHRKYENKGKPPNNFDIRNRNRKYCENYKGALRCYKI